MTALKSLSHCPTVSKTNRARFLGTLAITAAMGTLTFVAGCSTSASNTTSPNLPPPKPVVVASTPAAAPQSTPAPVTAPAASRPITSTTTTSQPAPAAQTGPAPTMSIDTGLYRCELGVRVTVKKIAPDKSTLVLNWKNKDHTLTAVGTQSGALRFEEKSSGLVWMAIVGKSQLLDSKLGQRLANDCNL
jgi:Membrane-bound lysozyme-inhibitor of c-type lysozyme